MLFRSTTCSNLAVVQGAYGPDALDMTAGNKNTAPYIDTSTHTTSLKANCEPDHARHELPTRLPHTLQLNDGRYALTYYEILTIPEDEECTFEVHSIVRHVNSSPIHISSPPSASAKIARKGPRYDDCFATWKVFEFSRLILPIYLLCWLYTTLCYCPTFSNITRDFITTTYKLITRHARWNSPDLRR